MIQISRALARQIRTVFRRCVRKPYGPPPPAVGLLTGPDGLRVRLPRPEFSVEYHQPGSLPMERMILPLEALDNFEGRGPDSVTLDIREGNRVLARWLDGGVPQEVEYHVHDPDKQPEVPDLPQRFAHNPPELLHALDEAAQTAPTEAVRYAVQRLQLRGSKGDIVATDGRQLLVQGGFTFPWEGDVLVPRLLAFSCKELGCPEMVEVGKTEKYVFLRVGCWTFALLIDSEARYPRVDLVIPKPLAGTTRLRIDPEDAAFLTKALPRLPGGEADHSPLTVDLNGQVSLRARAEGGRTTEVLLARSTFTGKPVRFCVNRKLLGRLLGLGFGEVCITNAEAPLLCQDGKRTFVTVPLPQTSALDSTEDSQRLVSASNLSASQELATTTPALPTLSPTNKVSVPDRRNLTVTTPHNNDHAAGAATPNGGLEDLIIEAEELRRTLLDGAGRAAHLAAALKQQRRQTRAVQAAMAALRQLQSDPSPRKPTALHTSP